MLKPYLLSLSIMILSSSAALAATSINEMQGCQAYLDFVDKKLTSLGHEYPSVDIKKIRTGLGNYNKHIQHTIITPGLLASTGNDPQKASETQGQIDAYKAHITESLSIKYQDDKLLSDHAIAINECAKKSAPKGADLQSLKIALELIVTLATRG